MPVLISIPNRINRSKKRPNFATHSNLRSAPSRPVPTRLGPIPPFADVASSTTFYPDKAGRHAWPVNKTSSMPSRTNNTSSTANGAKSMTMPPSPSFPSRPAAMRGWTPWRGGGVTKSRPYVSDTRLQAQT